MRAAAPQGPKPWPTTLGASSLPVPALEGPSIYTHHCPSGSLATLLFWVPPLHLNPYCCLGASLSSRKPRLGPQTPDLSRNTSLVWGPSRHLPTLPLRPAPGAGRAVGTLLSQQAPHLPESLGPAQPRPSTPSTSQKHAQGRILARQSRAREPPCPPYSPWPPPLHWPPRMAGRTAARAGGPEPLPLWLAGPGCLSRWCPQWCPGQRRVSCEAWD